MYGKIKRGERKPTLETLYRISCALNVKMSDIIIKIESELESAK
ncbi:MAG: helix-turn-helix transcriptional regulator [Ruminiclostridium sp.]|nr:helix-turn-helix transcriptional regulator [Ruminiclostridium sp.]